MGKKLYLFLACMLMSASMAFAQVSQVTGTVIDSDTGEPLTGAKVMVEGTTIGTLTDIDGKFTLKDLPKSARMIEVSFIGMNTVRAYIKPHMAVTLSSNAQDMDEVMVVAYGTAKKSTFTGSAVQIDAAQIEKRQVSNITNALTGLVSGVQTQSSNGQPGTSSTIRINGVGSMASSNSPLYVVDGMPYDGDISAINSHDVESLTVLKDAAAAALYGHRGANGVIIITTKKGKSGDPIINFDARWGSNSREISNYDVIKSPAMHTEQQYRTFYNQGIYSLGQTPEQAHTYANGMIISSLGGYHAYTVPNGQYLVGTNGKLNPAATMGYTDGTYYYTPDDWEKATFSSQLRQEYNLSIAASGDRLNYYISAGYIEDNGIISGSGFDRLSTRSNVDYKVKDWLKVGANLSFAYSTSYYPDEQTSTSSAGNAFYIANQIAPVYPIFVRDAQGTIMRDKVTGNPVYDYGDATLPGCPNLSRTFMGMANPAGSLLYDSNKYLMDIFNSKWYAEITPVDGLKLTASLGLSLDNTRNNGIGSPRYGQSYSYGGSAYQVHQRQSGFTQQYLANYNKTFKDVHNLDLLVGYESYSMYNEWSQAYGQNLYKNDDFTVNNTIDNRRGYGARNSYATQGILARANYDFDQKYYGSVSYRRDASSVFHPDHRWGNFWSASAGWMITHEKFMSGSKKWLDMLKLRASFGQQGNDHLLSGGSFVYQAYFDKYKVTGADGVFSDGNLTYKGNKDITWETSNNLGVGIDFGMFKGRFQGTLEYINRQTKDMLYYKPVASSNGFNEIPMNIGSVRNAGFQFDLKGQVIKTKDIQWELNLNGAFLQNKILKLHPELNGEWIDDANIYREGESMYQYYLPKYAGVDPKTGLAQYWAKDDDGNEYLTDNQATANNTNRVGTGNMMPKVFGGFGTTLNLYGFDLGVQFSYQLGGRVYDNTYCRLMNGGSSSYYGQAWHKDILKAWSPENTNTDVPRLNASDRYTNSLSDRWLISSNYLSLNNITLGYTFPKNCLTKLRIQNLRIYAAADNVAVFSARKGLDPRKGYSSINGATYSSIRTISGGIKVTF